MDDDFNCLLAPVTASSLSPFLLKCKNDFQYSVKIRFLKAIAKPDEWLKNYSSRSESTCPIYFFLGAWVAQWVRSHFFHDELYNLYKYSLSKICYSFHQIRYSVFGTMYIPFRWLYLEAMAYRLPISVKNFLFLDSFRILLFFLVDDQLFYAW